MTITGITDQFGPSSSPAGAADLDGHARQTWLEVILDSRAAPLAPPPDGGADPGHGDTLLSAGWTGAPAVKGPDELGFTVPDPAPGAALYELGVLDLIGAYRDGLTSPGEMVALLQDRIGDPRLSPESVLHLIDAAGAAADSAARIAAGTARPLEGIPFAVKDIIDVAGASVTCGSKLTGDRVAQRDSEVVARLRAAGAIPIAVTATTEFACGGPDNPRYGRVRNPWNAERWSGGSSAGSGAGLAARLFPFALGTDTGGSVRIPSAWCGTTGLKPTHGLVPRTGVASLSWTLDHVGPMTRSAADIAAVLPFMAGPDGADPLQVPGLDPVPPRDSLAGLRVGVARGWFTEIASPGVAAAFDDAVEVLRNLGATTVPVDLGDLRRVHQEAYLLLYCELASLQEANDDRVTLMDPGMAERYQRGLLTSAVDYLRALRRRPDVQRTVLTAMADVDLLVTPGSPSEAITFDGSYQLVYGDQTQVHGAHARNTMIFDYVGFPALMLPAGITTLGLPAGLQVVARPRADLLTLQVGVAVQRVTNFHRRLPPVCS